MTNAISTKDMGREEWLKARQKGIGASDAPIVCSISNWKTPLELYKEKRNELEAEDISGKACVRAGIMLEEIVARMFQEDTGLKVRMDNKIRMHKEYPFIMANLDRTVVDSGNGPAVLECKTTNAFAAAEWGETGTDNVPMYYLVQVQHQLAVTGYNLGYLAVLIGGQDFRYYEIPRNEELIENLIAIECEFWAKVQNGEEPEPTYDHKTTTDLLKKMYPGTNGEIVKLDDMAEEQKQYLEAQKELSELNKQVKAAEKKRNTFKNMLLSKIGEGSVGLFSDGTGLTRKLQQRKGYEVQAREFVDTRFSKKPAGV